MLRGDSSHFGGRRGDSRAGTGGEHLSATRPFAIFPSYDVDTCDTALAAAVAIGVGMTSAKHGPPFPGADSVRARVAPTAGPQTAAEVLRLREWDPLHHRPIHDHCRPDAAKTPPKEGCLVGVVFRRLWLVPRRRHVPRMVDAVEAASDVVGLERALKGVRTGEGGGARERPSAPKASLE